MAIALGTALVSAGDTTNATIYTTAALTNAPGAGNLIIGFICCESTAATVPTLSTVTGGGLTTVAVHATSVVYNSIASPLRRISCVRAQQSGAGATTAFTITFSGACIGAEWVFAQFTGMSDETANNGANAIIQLVTANSDTTTTTPSASNLATATDANNRPIACFNHNASSTADTARTNWTQIADVSHINPSSGHEVQWRSDAFETTYSDTFSGTSIWAAMAAEIKAPAATASLLPQQERARINLQAVNRASVW